MPKNPKNQQLRVLAQPVALTILRHLATHGEANVSTLVGATSSPQPNVSRILKGMREAGLVETRSEGNQRLYQLNPTAEVTVKAGKVSLAL